MPANSLIKFRQGSSSVWTSTNPVLASGEPGYETDTGRFKIGNGSTAWSSLNYAATVPTGLLAGTGINITLGSNSSTATISLTGLISGAANNRILTSRDSSTTGIDAETNLVFDGSKLGINTSAPTGALHVIGSGLISTTTGIAPNALLHTYSSTTGSTIFNVEGTNGSLFSVVDSLSGSLMSVNNNAGLPVFEVFSDDSIIAGRFNQNDWVVTSGGNIGIGTGIPSTKFYVVGTSRFDGDVTVTGSVIVGSGSAILPSIEFVNDPDTGAFSPSSNIFAISTSGVERLRINNSGYVGVGTNNPLYQLSVVGTGNFSQNLLVNGTGVSISGHIHTASNISDFNSSVSGLLPVTNIVAGTNISVSNTSGTFTINGNAGGGGGGASITNSGTNRLLVSDGTTSGIVGQANLTFDGSFLNVVGSGAFSNNLNLSNQTGNRIAGFDANKNVVSLDTNTYPSLTELTYLKNVTSAVQTQLNNKSDTTHTHGNISSSGTIGSVSGRPVITTANGALTTTVFGSIAGTFCEGNDSRLSDARTPLSHTHGNITNAGAIGSTANLPLITTTAGAITTGSFGTAANTFCQGNDSRLSDARTPLSHIHIASNVSDFNSSVSGLVSGVYAPLTGTLNQFNSTSSAQLRSIINDEVGSGLLVFNDSPTFTGIPLVPTATSGTTTNQIASTSFVRTEISNLIASAPSTLDTLNELALALGNDANFSTTVTNSLASKANLSGAIFTGAISGPSGNFTVLQQNGTNVSISGHNHLSSDISNFNSSVSGLLPVTNIVAGNNITVSNTSGTFTINGNAGGGGLSPATYIMTHIFS